MMHAPWSYDAVLYELNVRQFTPEGTLRAATRRLEFLRSIGVDILWLMPVYPIGEEQRKGTLGSAYSIRDYTAVNPELGTMADLDALIGQAHALGMHVLLDWVANHTARDARWVSERPADWYERDEGGVPLVPWDWSDTAKLNYANRAMWRDQIDAMRFWVEEHRVDGFRCDMAMLVPFEFWQTAAAELRSLRGDLFLLAEAEEPYLFDAGVFDACYGWQVHHLMNDIAQQKTRLWPLREWIYADRERYPRRAIRLSFTSNHDENTWSGTEFERMGDAARIMAVLTFLWPQSMPLIYTGQEVGYDRRMSLFEREPIPGERYRANDFTTLYRTLCALKHDNAALRAGEAGGPAIELRNNAEDCLLTFVREVGDNRVVALLNLSPYTIQADFDTGIYAGAYTDALTGAPTTLAPHVDEVLAPWTYRIMKR